MLERLCLVVTLGLSVVACDSFRSSDKPSKSSADDDDGDKKKKKDDDDGEERDDESNDSGDTKPAKAKYAVGDKLMVSWKGETYPATVIEVVSQDQVKIHYDGYDASWDEVVGPDRIKGTTGSPSGDTPGEVVPGKEATPFIDARSPVPTLAEWNAVTKEVVVHGSSLRNCETKMVREWLRVSCRGKPDHFGEPVSVRVLKGGGRGEDFAFSSTGVTSLVVRFVPGVDLEADFVWEFRNSVLRVFWPRGAPEPPYKGKFAAPAF